MIITAKDLTEADRNRLNGGVEHIIQKSDRDEMLRRLTGELSKWVKPTGRGASMKILYVEDNEDNIYMLKSRLTRAGYTVLVATDGAQGVAMATSERPDLVLMDLSLPVLDGWEAARRIKAAPETSGIPIIALTAHVMPGDQEKALAAGCDDFDTKPVELSRLLGKIRALAPSGERAVNKAEAALLVVDDNEDNRYALTRRLARERLCKRRHGSGRPASLGAFAQQAVRSCAARHHDAERERL